MRASAVGIWAGAGLLVCGAVGFGVSRLARPGARDLDLEAAAAELPQTERAYRAAGMPWTAKDLRSGASGAGTSDREARRAAALLRKATPAVARWRWTQARTELRASLDAGDLAPIEARLATYAPTLALVEEAARIGRADFARDLDRGPNTPHPELPTVRTVSGVLALRAQARAARGDLAGARADLGTIRTLARMAEGGGGLLTLLVRISGDAVANDAARRAAAQDPRLAQGALADLERAAREPAPDLLRALRHEAYTGLATTRNLFGQVEEADVAAFFSDRPEKPGVEEGFRIEENPARLRRDGVPTEVPARAYTARMLQVWTRIAGAMRREGRDPVRLGAEIDRITAADEANLDPSHRLNRIVMPVFTLAGVAVAKARADREITRAYLRAIETRRRTGRFPATLLAGNDPFGRPYVGRREGDGFRIYSLGANGRDDGGLTATERAALRPPVTAGAKDDIAARFPPAPRSGRW